MINILAYRPFLDPLPVADYWMWLILPLCMAVAIVWKAMKCQSIRNVWRESLTILIWIIGGFFATALVLMLIVHLVGN